MIPLQADLVRRKLSSLRENLENLSEAGVLPEGLAERLAPSSGLRNRLVHEYETVHDRLVLEAVRAAPEEFGAFIRAVEECLEARGL